MNSLGKPSKWPSCDSLPSTPSFLHSESEQTEDEADVRSSSSEGEGESGGGGVVVVVVSEPFSVAFPGHSSDQPYCRSEHHQAEQRRPDNNGAYPAAPSPGAAAFNPPSPATPGDMAFAQKCADLNRFIRPLLELLNGLKMGRFDKGLSSFQQSVAMDRLQRILGVLQKPDMGEKYLRTLLQVEMMLKLWFPRVVSQPVVTPTQNTIPGLLSRWRQNQLHIPVKKRKLSWLDPGPSSTTSPQHKCHQHCQAATTPRDAVVPTCRLGAPQKQQSDPEEGEGRRHELTDSTCTLNRPSY